MSQRNSLPPGLFTDPADQVEPGNIALAEVEKMVADFLAEVRIEVSEIAARLVRDGVILPENRATAEDAGARTMDDVEAAAVRLLANYNPKPN